jgi:hypothetical protein
VEDPPKEGSEGYPEEQPGEVADDDSRRDDRESDTPDEADRGDERKATGNPRSAG